MTMLIFYLLCVEWIFLWLKVSATVAPCVENRDEICLQNLATFISLGKPTFATESELEELCSDAQKGQRCSSEFLRTSTCVSPRDEILIPLQIGRSQAVSQMLCSIGGYIEDPVFRKKYLKNSPCIQHQARNIEECYTSANLVKDPEFLIVENSSKSMHEKHLSACCPLMQYIECSERIIAADCGEEAKNVVVKVLLKTAGKQLNEFCTNVDAKFPNNPAVCVNDAEWVKTSFLLNIIVFCALFFASILF